MKSKFYKLYTDINDKVQEKLSGGFWYQTIVNNSLFSVRIRIKRQAIHQVENKVWGQMAPHIIKDLHENDRNTI